ncbi:hypothetical protein Y032_0030g2083 [Ancylostoma ceylanicum]|uniref:Uncharacterized protein n=1 Tax=Ancylostoma ceylanicum TaxID=53326 RepID=A0A016USN9_9BILA|nr:hypothetical protein Y032_0030g2083 [Ancylostoma ceylanicum]
MDTLDPGEYLLEYRRNTEGEGRGKPPAKARTPAKTNFCSKVVAIVISKLPPELPRALLTYRRAGYRALPKCGVKLLFTLFIRYLVVLEGSIRRPVTIDFITIYSRTFG